MINALSVSDSNISVAWAKAFLALMHDGGTQKCPAIVSIGPLEGEAVENLDIRAQLDARLKASNENSCATVAGTLFPTSMWNPALPNDAESLFSRYERAWPAIARCPANRNGVYFRRLTAYMPSHYTGKAVNQLDFVISTYRSGNHRRSALQASVLDPTRDHTNNRQKGFPCLQQVAFTPVDEGLCVTGFYATQYQFEKAYGNYLGLYWLGQFMAKQLGLRLSRVVCVASALSLGNQSKASLKALERGLAAQVTPSV